MKNILKHSAIISVMTFISRIFGFVRDVLIARVFGISPALDAFIVAFKIPNFFRRLFAEGAFSQAVMPTLAESKQQQCENEVINHITGRLFVILFIATIIAVIASPVITFAFAWGFYFNSPEQFFLASDLLKITLPYLLLISLTAFFGGILNTNDKFLVPAITPMLLNIAMILATIFIAPTLDEPIFALAWGVLFGGILQLIFQLPFLMRIGKLPRPTNKKHKVFTTLKKRMLPAIFGLSVSQINLLIDTMVASTLIAGSISWLYYANRLLELPLAVIGVAIGVVSIAKLSKYFASGDDENFAKTINDSLKLAIIFAIPATVGLIVLAEPLIITLFAYDNFTLVDAHNAALALSAYGFGLVFFILIKTIVPIFLARGDTKTPVKAGVIAMLSNISLNVVLAYYYSFVGIAIATSISAVLNLSVLLWFAYKQRIYSIPKSLWMVLMRVVIATAMMLMVLLYLQFEYSDVSVMQRITNLSMEILFSMAIYFLSLTILKFFIAKFG